MLPFLAQFLEKVDGRPSLGTQTGTRASGEDPDTDEDLQRRVGSPDPALGTRTVTEVGGEEQDTDAQARLGTETMTKATDENSDTDAALEQGTLWEAWVL